MALTEEQRRERAQYDAAITAELEKRRRIVNEAGATPAGKELLRMVKDLCGFEKADRVVRADGQLDLTAMAVNSERRNVYLNLRGLMTPDVRLSVEHGSEEAK